jgi:hypothetical protein
MRGDIMGNCLDDPRYLFDENGQATTYQYTMLPDPEANVGVIREGGPNSFYCMGGPDNVRNWWPGEFFYRSGGDFSFDVHPDLARGDRFQRIWGWPYMRITKYIMGAYGSLRTEGMDVIRLTTKDGFAAAEMPGAEFGIINGEYYQDNTDPTRLASHPHFRVRVKYSNPEVMGGGERGLMPQFPYYEADSLAWIFGSQDGFMDGVILVLTSTGLEHEMD